MINLRERIEHDLGVSLEGRWGLPVGLLDPDGSRQEVSGQIVYDIVRMNPETGEEMLANASVVVLRRSSLARIPVAGEKWLIDIPETPCLTASKIQYAMSPTRPPEGGRSIGFIRIYLQQVEQL